jgi:hypothetical protein
MNFTPETEKLLRRAGWYPGRQVLDKVKLAEGFTLFPAAKSVLDEFGGLIIGERGPGRAKAKAVIEMDPSSGEHLVETYKAYEHDQGVLLYPIGSEHLEIVYLLIDAEGRCYLNVDTDIWRKVATTFERSLEILLHGLEKEPWN